MKEQMKELIEKEKELIKLISNLTEEEWEELCTNMSKAGLTVAEVGRNVGEFAEMFQQTKEGSK